MENLFGDFDFDLLKSPDFKEDSVRSFLIDPLLKELGYSPQGENLNVLETIAVQTGKDQWKLNESGQGELFSSFE